MQHGMNMPGGLKLEQGTKGTGGWFGDLRTVEE